MRLSVSNYHFLIFSWAGIYRLEYTWSSWNYGQRKFLRCILEGFSVFSPRFACSGSVAYSPVFSLDESVCLSKVLPCGSDYPLVPPPEC